MQEAQNKLSATIAEPIFHRVRDVAPNKVCNVLFSILANETRHTLLCFILSLRLDLASKV
jgi:hypothetical protein